MRETLTPRNSNTPPHGESTGTPLPRPRVVRAEGENALAEIAVLLGHRAELLPGFGNLTEKRFDPSRPR